MGKWKEHNSQELDFSQFMEGGLNKAELLYVLAYGPKSIPEEGFTEESFVFIMNSLCQGTNENGELYFSELGWDEQSRGIYAAADVNRYISSFTDFQYPGDTVALALSTLNYVESAELYQTKFTSLGGKIELYFHDHQVKYDEAEEITDVDRVATLLPTESGKYRITKIEQTEAARQTKMGRESAAFMKRFLLECSKNKKFKNHKTF